MTQGIPDDIIRFGPFELDLRSGELRRAGRRIALQDQPFKILSRLLKKPGEVVTREALRQELWPADTFVDFERSLNAAVKRLRDALGDSAETPLFVETLPKRGYRFIAPAVRTNPQAADQSDEPSPGPIEAAPPPPAPAPPSRWQSVRWRELALFLAGPAALIAIGAYFTNTRPGVTPQGVLTRLTFQSGLQTEPTWSPDGRFIAYSANSAGNFDIWVQPAVGGEPVQVTNDRADDWQPDWSPDGSQLVFRSERDGGGLFVVSALGGQPRRLTAFGYQPRWSPDGSQILFASTGLPALNVFLGTGLANTASGVEDIPPLWLVDIKHGGPPREILSEIRPELADRPAVAWHPDGRVSVWGPDRKREWKLSTFDADGARRRDSQIAPPVKAEMARIELDFESGSLVWSPSADAVFLTCIVKEVQSICRFDVEPTTLAWIGGPHRLTSGPADASNVVVSRDGTRLAFTAETRTTRVWQFPVDPETGQPLGLAEPVTSAEIDAFGPDVTADGTQLLYLAERPGGPHRHEIRLRSLGDGREELLRSDAVATDGTGLRFAPRLSPDGRVVSYRTSLTAEEGGHHIAIHDVATGTESLLTAAPAPGYEFAWSWTADGRWLVGSGTRHVPDRSSGLWLLPVEAGEHAGERVQVVTTSSTHTIFQAAASPSHDWIAFQAVPNDGGKPSAVFAVHASGGPWMPISGGADWKGRPVWSRDGRYVYFLSSREGLLNIWGVPFDAGRGETIGDPFQVTRLNNPQQRIYPSVAWTEIASAPGRLMAPVLEVAGSVWMLDGVDR